MQFSIGDANRALEITFKYRLIDPTGDDKVICRVLRNACQLLSSFRQTPFVLQNTGFTCMCRFGIRRNRQRSIERSMGFVKPPQVTIELATHSAEERHIERVECESFGKAGFGVLPAADAALHKGEVLQNERIVGQSLLRFLVSAHRALEVAQDPVVIGAFRRPRFTRFRCQRHRSISGLLYRRGRIYFSVNRIEVKEAAHYGQPGGGESKLWIELDRLSIGVGCILVVTVAIPISLDGKAAQIDVVGTGIISRPGSNHFLLCAGQLRVELLRDSRGYFAFYSEDVVQLAVVALRP